MLYGDQGLTDYLKKHFVFHWSSERPVPKVTIDFGDGRTLKRTITGNSLHMMLNTHGEVIGVMPALMDAQTFHAACEDARRRDAETKEIADADERQAAILDSLIKLANTRRRWYRQVAEEATRAPEVVVASKMSTQMSLTRSLGAIGAMRSLILSPGQDGKRRDALQGERKVPAPEVISTSLGESSNARKALLPSPSKEAIATQDVLAPQPIGMNYGNSAMPDWLIEAIKKGSESEEAGWRKVQSFSRTLAEDSYNSAFALTPQIIALLKSHKLNDFDGIVEDVYAKVFFTPRSDPWLGLKDASVWDGHLPDSE